MGVKEGTEEKDGANDNELCVTLAKSHIATRVFRDNQATSGGCVHVSDEVVLGFANNCPSSK